MKKLLNDLINILIILLILLLIINSFSLVDNNNDHQRHRQFDNIINPYHLMSENVMNKVFLHKLNVWRKHYRNFTKEQIEYNKKRFELLDTYIVPTYPMSKKNIAILWRSHSPTDNAINRIKKWAKEFQNYNKLKKIDDINYSLHMTMDISAGNQFYISTKEKLEDYDITFHTYTNRNMTSNYPILIEMLKRVPPYFFEHSLSVAKGFHIESICLWWTWIQINSKLPRMVTYDDVWVLEDDIGITGGKLRTGSLLEFVKLYDEKDWRKENKELNYENDYPDLITYGKYYTAKDAYTNYYDSWVYHDTVSNTYASLIHEREQFYTQEHIQRFSARYINLLHHYTKINRITAWSEQESISIITHLKPKWRVGFIAFGNIGRYEVISRISQEKFESIEMIENNNTNSIKLWHALKW